MTVSEFLARYPEFSKATDELLTKVLTETEGRIDAAVFGDRFEEAHAALAAHALWSSAFGVPLRLDGESPETSKYKQHYDRILKDVSVPLTVMVL